MRFGLSAALAVLFAAVLTAAQVTAPVEAEMSPEQQELCRLEREWSAALERKDRATLERFLAPDYYISDPGNLEKVPRAEWLENAIALDWTNLSYENFKVDMYGDTAVVTASLSFRVVTKIGLPISSDAQVVDVWVKHDGQWRVAARHLGDYSFFNYVLVGLGIVAALAGMFLVWLLRRLLGRRRRARAA